MRINHKEPGKPLTLQAAETPSELIALISDAFFFFFWADGGYLKLLSASSCR